MKRFLFTLSILSILLLGACQGQKAPEPIESKIDSIDELNAPAKETESLAENEADSQASVATSNEVIRGTEEEPSTVIKTQLEPQQPTLGWIEGSVSYPSEGLPEDLEVCAGQVEGGNEMYCTNQWIEDENYTYGFGYKLAVPPGIYQVMAARSNGGLTGWYSAFMTCGETSDCTDHTPLNVGVKAGEGIEGIDPGDWY